MIKFKKIIKNSILNDIIKKKNKKQKNIKGQKNKEVGCTGLRQTQRAQAMYFFLFKNDE